MKKVWEKPKLVVLFKGKPEEGVLLACKLGKLEAYTGGAYAENCQQASGGPCSTKGTT